MMSHSFFLQLAISGVEIFTEINCKKKQRIPLRSVKINMYALAKFLIR